MTSTNQSNAGSNPVPFVSPGQPLNDFLRSFWQRQVDSAEQDTTDYRHPPLPLARIKKVMKSDPDVKMISADTPILFCKACEIFIAEITARAFIIADANKRRTLSRADIAKALSKSDQFDFLIDIVPREDLAHGHVGGEDPLHTRTADDTAPLSMAAAIRGSVKQEESLDPSGSLAALNAAAARAPSDVLNQLESLLSSNGQGPSSVDTR